MISKFRKDNPKVIINVGGLKHEVNKNRKRVSWQVNAGNRKCGNKNCR